MKPGMFTLNFFSALFVLSVFAFTYNVEGNRQDFMKSMVTMMDRMHRIESTHSFDRDFSQMMAEHHQGAIDMSEEVLKDAIDEKLIALVKKMMEVQKTEMKQLCEFAAKNKAGADASGKNKDVLTKPVRQAMDEMRMMKAAGNAHEVFTDVMIMHHISGIELANLEISSGKDEKLKKLCKKMIDGHNADIKSLQDWLNNKTQETD